MLVLIALFILSVITFLIGIAWFVNIHHFKSTDKFYGMPKYKKTSDEYARQLALTSTKITLFVAIAEIIIALGIGIQWWNFNYRLNIQDGESTLIIFTLIIILSCFLGLNSFRKHSSAFVSLDNTKDKK